MGRPVVYYRDPFSSFFWWWLLDQSIDTRAQWAYHHQHDMDSARYAALMADSDLAARVRRLEEAQTQADPHYVPAGLQQDLMYNDQYVQDSYRHATRPAQPSWAFWLLAVPAGGLAGAFAIWLLFFKKWNVN